MRRLLKKQALRLTYWKPSSKIMTRSSLPFHSREQIAAAESPLRPVGGSSLSKDRKRRAEQESGPARGRQAPFLHISLAILNTSQPRAAKPTPQKSMTEATASPS